MRFLFWVDAMGGQTAVAKKLGVTRTCVHNWLKGLNGPSFSLKERIYKESVGAVTPEDMEELTRPRRRFTGRCPCCGRKITAEEWRIARENSGRSFVAQCKSRGQISGDVPPRKRRRPKPARDRHAIGPEPEHGLPEIVGGEKIRSWTSSSGYSFEWSEVAQSWVQKTIQDGDDPGSSG